MLCLEGLLLDLLPVGGLDKIGEIKPVHVVDMGVNPPGFSEVHMVPLVDEFGQPHLPHLHQVIHVDDLDMPLPQREIHDLFVLEG